MLLESKRLLVTGVLTEKSIAYAVADRALAEGAEVVLTGFGRGLRITERMAKRLPGEPDVLELDVNDPAQIEAVAAELDSRWGALDGVLHAIAFVPPDALGGNFLSAPADSAVEAFRTSAFSLKALAAGLLPLLEKSGGAVVGLDFDASRAWPSYDWAGVSKAALESVSRYLARDLGPRGVRCNLVAAGPLNTMAARPSPTPASSCSHRSAGRSPARSCTPTAAFTPWAQFRENEGTVPSVSNENQGTVPSVSRGAGPPA
jgi:meromycolic acid enoyl-[acyl-carrier-protein] reductase